MRLWHIDLIPFLPKSQLLAQWRELNSIFKKQDKHILINYVYEHEKEFLLIYSKNVIDEMRRRNIKIKSYDNACKYFSQEAWVLECSVPIIFPDIWRFPEHDNEYLTICYWNLREKYLRGQKDFSAKTWNKIEKFYKERMKK